MPHFFHAAAHPPPHPSFRPILYHSGQFSGILGQKVWAAGIVFILLPSIFRTPQCGQYKPNQYVMKKIFLLLAAAAAASGAYAEGYQVNNLSSKQNGMGHVGTAMKLNSESIWFNPAAASFRTPSSTFRSASRVSLRRLPIRRSPTIRARPNRSTTLRTTA